MIREDIKRKLNPKRFPRMSPMMTAIVCYLLDLEPQATPAIVDLCCTSDGFVLAQQIGDCGHNAFIGTYPDLRRNWNDLISVPGVGLAPEEAEFCRELLKKKVTMFETMKGSP